MMEKPKILDLIAKDRLQEALASLEAVSDRNNLKMEWRLLSGRWNEYEKRRLAGTVSSDDLERKRNKLREELCDFTERCFTRQSPYRVRIEHRLVQWRWPLSIAAVVLLLTVIGLFPVREISFEASLIVTDIQFRFLKDSKDEFQFAAARCDLTQLAEVRGSDWTQTMDEWTDEPLDVFLDSGRIEIELAHVPIASAMNVRIRGEDVTFSLPEGGNGTVLTDQTLLRIRPSNIQRSTDTIELLEWVAEPGAELSFKPLAIDTTFHERPLGIQAIEFVQKSLSSGRLQTAIISGELCVIAQDTVLIDREFLEFKGLHEAYIRRLRQQGSALALEIKGSARDIRSGMYLKNTHSHKPTILEYFYHNQKISLLVTVVLSAVSFFLSIYRASDQSK